MTDRLDLEDRYVIGRDGVFATLYDREEDRLVVENSTEEHCRRVRADIIRAAAAADLVDIDDNSGDGWDPDDPYGDVAAYERGGE